MSRKHGLREGLMLSFFLSNLSFPGRTVMNKTQTGPQPRVRLTEARNARGWSQMEVADSIGTTYVNVSRWERGITRPSPYFRKKLCVLFSKTEQELDLVLESEALPTVVESNPSQ